jgi:hypothetical protein
MERQRDVPEPQSEELEHTPEHAVGPETAARYQAMNEEFRRRARLAWTPAS